MNNPMVESFLPLSQKGNFSKKTVDNVKSQRNRLPPLKRAVPLKPDFVLKGKIIPQPPNHGLSRVVRYGPPPPLPKPKRHHNYRNVMPSVILYTLGSNPNRIAPVSSRYWPNPPPLPTPRWKGWAIDIPTIYLNGKDSADNVSPLSVIPREEVNDTTTIPKRTEPSRMHDDSPLIDRAIENASIKNNKPQSKTPSPINAEAKTFFPRFDFNPFANSWIPNCLDPFGNIKQCASPTNEIIQQQHNIYELLDPSLDIHHNANCAALGDTTYLQIDTTHTEIYSPYHQNAYSPTTPTPYFPTPTSISEYSEYAWDSHPQEDFMSYNEFFEPTEYLYDFPTPTNNQAATVNLSNPRPPSGYNTPSSAMSHPGCNDPLNKISLETVSLISQNVMGWRNSLKFESCIQMMLDQNIDAMCVQETWDLDNYVKTVREFLVIHHNVSDNNWKKKKKQGGPRKGVAIILSPYFKEAYARAGSPKPITTEENSEFEGRFIGISLLFPSKTPQGNTLESKPTKLFIASIYHPWEPDDYDDFNSTASTLLSRVPDNSIKIIGHDLNASVGVRKPDDPECISQVIGPYGLDNRNEKGSQAISFLLQMDLRVMSTYFEHKYYTTHLSKFTTPHTPLTLDSISVSSNGMKRVRDCKVCELGIPSDHSAILLKFCLTSIKYKNSSELSNGVIDWHSIQNNEDLQSQFNAHIEESLPPNASYTEFTQAILKAGYSTATKPKYRRVGWFEDDCEALQPLVTKKTELIHKIRASTDPVETEELQTAYKIVCKETKDRSEIAKNKWARKLGNEINCLNMSPRQAWQAAYEIRDGVRGHHTTPSPKIFKNAEGILASSKEENVQNVNTHFTKVFNSTRPFNDAAVEALPQRGTMYEVGDPPTWEEFRRAVFKLKNDKQPGKNGVMPNAFKCLDNHNLSNMFNFIKDFWHGEVDFEEWHESIGSLVPKKGDIQNLNKWRCINLMDVGS